MDIATVNKDDLTEKKDPRGRKPKYEKLYKELKKLSPDEAKRVSFDSELKRDRVYSAIRHKNQYNVKRRGLQLIVTLSEDHPKYVS